MIHYFLPDYHSALRRPDLPVGARPARARRLPVDGGAARGGVLHPARVARSRWRGDADAVGFAAGLALAVKPANSLFLPAPSLALLVARKPRVLVVLAAATLPSLLGLADVEVPAGSATSRLSPTGTGESSSPRSGSRSSRGFTSTCSTATRISTGSTSITTSTASASTPGASAWCTSPPWRASSASPAARPRRGPRRHLVRVLSPRQGHLPAGRPRRGRLHHPPAHRLPRLLPARDLPSVPDPDLRPSPARPPGRRSAGTALPAVAVGILGFLSLAGSLPSQSARPRLRRSAASPAKLYLPLNPFPLSGAVPGQAVRLFWARFSAAGRSSGIVRHPSRRDRGETDCPPRRLLGHLAYFSVAGGGAEEHTELVHRSPAARHLGLPRRAQRNARRTRAFDRLHHAPHRPGAGLSHGCARGTRLARCPRTSRSSCRSC